jgi:hypothetical protein
LLKFCKQCAKAFSAKPSTKARFCSRPCAIAWRRPLKVTVGKLLVAAAIALLPLAAEAKPRKKPTKPPPPVTILDISKPEPPSNPLPDTVDKGKL